MARKAKECDDGKSTVIKIRDEEDWGRILYDACCLFNRRFGAYLVEYAGKYDGGGIISDDIDAETDGLVARRDRLVEERRKLHDAVRMASAGRTDAFRRYAKALPLGTQIAKWRRDLIDGIQSDAPSVLKDRAELNRAYRSSVDAERLALADERRHIDANLYVTRTLNRQMRGMRKIVDRHRIPLGHPMADDVEALRGLIESDGQAERLMAVCLNILNTYSEREFTTMMGNVEKERIAEGIYEFFSKFEHNYDFLSGCYDVDEATGMLALKPMDVLAGKIYNGYYFTIRGYVQRSYAAVRFERFNIESVDEGWQDDDGNGNHGVDRVASSEMEAPPQSREPEPLDEGMMDFWRDCNAFLRDNLGEMAGELASEMSVKFPSNPYYHVGDVAGRMKSVMSSTIDGIDGELVSGNVIGTRLKHIILDAMGGAESDSEWRQTIAVVSGIIVKYMSRFFRDERIRSVENGSLIAEMELEEDE